MRVLLVVIAGVGATFLPEPSPPRPLAQAGERGWFERRRVVVAQALEHGQGLTARTLRGAWRLLQRLVDRDESLLRSLRSADRIDVDHPSVMTEHEVRRRWDNYLLGRMWKHRTWLIIDALLCPCSLILVPLPGPNVVGFWLVYRTVLHGLAARGASRCRAGRASLSCRPRTDLDSPIERGDHERIDRLSASIDFADLAEAIDRVGPRRNSSP